MMETWLAKSNLTLGQMMLSLGQKLEPNKPMYNMALCFRMPKSIDADRLRESIQICIDGSDALRTIVIDEQGVPRSKVMPQLTIPWDTRSFESRGEAVDWMTERSQENFRLNECLFENVFVSVRDEDSFWYVNQHHLITDGWSCSVLFQRVSEIYSGLRSGSHQNAVFPQYSDYVAFEESERQNTESAELTKARTHWRGLENEATPPPELGRSASHPNSTNTVRKTRVLPAKLIEKLAAVAQLPEARSFTRDQAFFTIFSSLLIAWQHRVSGQMELSLGAPALNRVSPEFKNTIGVFIELFPLRTQLNPNETFASLMKKMRAESNNFVRYARSGASSPQLQRSFNVVLNYITAGFGEFDGSPIQCSWLHCGHSDPGHHFRLHVHDFDGTGELTLHFDLNEGVFSTEDQERVIGQFQNLLEALVDDPYQEITSVTLPEDGVVEEPFGFLNQSDFEFSGGPTVLEEFARRVAQAPDRIALRLCETSLTYTQLDQLSDSVAERIRLFLRDNDEDETVVGLCTSRCMEGVVGFLGILKAGCVCLPLAPDFPPQRLEYILDDSKAKLTLVSRQALNGRPELAQRDFFEISLETETVERSSAACDDLVRTKGDESVAPENAAYIIYTSGSTGKPKGVVIEHRSLLNYAVWAAKEYTQNQPKAFPWFTPLTFDLTITSIFVPLVTGGEIVIYPESNQGSDIALLDVIDDNRVDVVKLTPSHLALLQGRRLTDSRVKALILGGEDLKRETALSVTKSFGDDVTIYNEYGPTEATVGCMIHAFDPAADQGKSVPIGKASGNAQVYLLDQHLRPVAEGVAGEVYIGGSGLARSYLNRSSLTEEKFVRHPWRDGQRLYRTGDLAKVNSNGLLEYGGRIDAQVKVRGVRIELGELESELLSHPKIREAAANLFSGVTRTAEDAEHHCTKCGLPSNYPGASFDSSGVCHLCNGFSRYQEKTKSYFRTESELTDLLNSRPVVAGQYDCMALLSGGKDSTYVLARLVDMGKRVFAFTLDNGFLSDQAKQNISRTVEALGVDHVFATTPAMNAIFADSLQKHSNVCNGCFKTVYTLAIQKAKELNIPWVVTGLSRGQFFETRLTEEIFRGNDFDPSQIDDAILAARKAYHRADDAVNRLIADKCFQGDEVFEDVQFIDFFRYCDVSLDGLYEYLDKRTPWARPTDTGRSTNCLINDAGIYVHKKERGFHNYAFPYSWDVRIGHKKREAALEELDDEIDEASVNEMLETVGYTVRENQADEIATQLVGYYVSGSELPVQELREFLAKRVPSYLLPSRLVQLNELPLSSNGKLNRDALPAPNDDNANQDEGYVAPRDEIEEKLAEIWSRLLRRRIGVFDNFFDVGGDSILAIQIVARANERGFQLKPSALFANPTVATLAKVATQGISQANQRTVSGKLKSLPIHQWFFETVKHSRGQWNQSLTVSLPRSVKLEALQDAFGSLLTHHDALRTRLEDQQLWIASEEKGEIVREASERTLDSNLLERERNREFNLISGPLVSAVLIKKDSGSNELLIVAHHLVVDALSWPILMKDLADLLDGQPLPLKSTDIRTWASQVGAPSGEQDYWINGIRGIESPLCLPRDQSERVVDQPASELLSATLSPEETHKLLASSASLPNQIVSAILVEMQHWAGTGSLGIEFEGHGREELVDEADISRTVGWFTSRFPVWFSLDSKETVHELHAQVKDSMSRLPRKGVGYGLMRYLDPSQEVRDTLANAPKPEILFNYLGHSNQLIPDDTIFDLVEPLTLHRGGHLDRTHTFEISATIDQGRLVILWDYNPAWHSEQTVRERANAVLLHLRALSEKAVERGESIDSFPQANLDRKKFDKLAKALKNLK